MNRKARASHLAAADEDLRDCVHCGFCLPVCPTYLELGDENDSPRGRIVLMRAAASGEVTLDGAVSTHLGRCLGCRACEPVCPAGVRYGHLLELARADLSHGSVDRMALTAVTSGVASRLLYALGRGIRSAPLLMDMLSRIPGRPGRLMRLLGATKPTLPGGGSTRASTTAGSTHGPPIEGPDYVLLEGCVMSGLFGHVHGATRRVLAAGGAREVVAVGQTCCGALHAHAGRLEEARLLARRNIEAFESAGDALVVTNSAGCGAALRDYPSWFAADDEMRTRAERLAKRVRDISEVVMGLADRLPPMRLSGTVAYDAPCHLVHGQRIAVEPVAMLNLVEGLEVRRLPAADRCCGGAGLYNLEQPELADSILAPKLREIRSSGCDWIATGNPGCMMFIGAGLRNADDKAVPVHPLELLDAGLRLGAPTQSG